MADNAFNDSGRVEFISAKKAKSIIKVIGVGGGGGNAVNHMYREGIHDVTRRLTHSRQTSIGR